MERTKTHRSRKVLLSLAAVGAAASIAALGTYASFTSTTQATQTVSTGTVVIALGSTGASTNRLNVNATGLVPGDTVQRSVDLIDSGNQNLSSITLSTTATATSLLDSDAVNGLQMVIDSCTAPWTEAGTAPAYTYSCSGSTASVLASQPVIGTNLALTNLASLTAGVTDYLRVTLTLPSATGNTFQALSSTIQYTFNAMQRAATNQ